MKRINLVSLSLKNFKGIKAFELHADGQNIEVYGKNEAGKTTVFDAFIWLLFDKDSHNNATNSFSIKTLKDGETIHNLNHEVSATFLVDGNELELRKVYAEKWTQKRGSVTKEFTGHSTDHFIDGVPSNKTEYTQKVAEILDEEAFKLLTSPTHFNEQLHWKKRRALLLEIVGDVSDEKVIASNKDLEKLTDMLKSKSIDDLRKIIAAKRKEINQELEDIPIRIDEIERNRPDIGGLDESDVTDRIDELNHLIEVKTEKLNDIRNGSEINKIKAEISDIDLKLVKVKNGHLQQEQEDVFKLKTKLQEEESNLNILNSKYKSNKTQHLENHNRIKSYEEDMRVLRDKWNKRNGEIFTHEIECSCPTCGQDLPEEHLNETRDKAEKQFNARKSQNLEDIKNEGLNAKQKIDDLVNDNDRLSNEMSKLADHIEAKKETIEKIKWSLKKAQSEVTPIEENEQYKQLIKQKRNLESNVITLQQSVDASVSEVKVEIDKLKLEQNNFQIDLSKIKQFEQSVKRVQELEQQQKDLAAEFERQEEALYLAEEFIRTKVDLLEDLINSKFKFARFNLFKTNINGGLEEVCDTTYKGVPFKDMNDGAIINIGLDIIDTLSAHYGVRAPIFIDNAEQVTDFFAHTKAQLIKLIASKDDNVLRIEKTHEMEMV